MHASNSLLTAVLVVGSVSFDQDVQTLPPLNDGKAPRNFEEIWGGFDRCAEPLEVEFLKEWENQSVALRSVRFRIRALR
jgi:hypothetical protein